MLRKVKQIWGIVMAGDEFNGNGEIPILDPKIVEMILDAIRKKPLTVIEPLKSDEFKPGGLGGSANRGSDYSNLLFIPAAREVSDETKKAFEKLMQEYKENPDKYNVLFENAKNYLKDGKFKIEPIDGSSFTPKDTDAKGEFSKITLQNKEAGQKDEGVDLFGIKNQEIPNNKEKNV